MCWYWGYLLLKEDSLANTLNTAIYSSSKRKFYSVGRGLLGNDDLFIYTFQIELYDSDIQEVVTLVSSWSPVDQWTRFWQPFLFKRNLVIHLPKIFPALCETCGFITHLKRVPHCHLFWFRWIQSTLSYPLCVTAILLSSPYIHKCNTIATGSVFHTPSRARNAVTMSYYLTLNNCYS